MDFASLWLAQTLDQIGNSKNHDKQKGNTQVVHDDDLIQLFVICRTCGERNWDEFEREDQDERDIVNDEDYTFGKANSNQAEQAYDHDDRIWDE